MNEIAFIICGESQVDPALAGRNDNCKDCGRPIFVTRCNEREVQETGATIRPICSTCGMTRFADEKVDMTPGTREMVKAMYGDELLRLIEAAPLADVEQVIREFQA